MCTPPAAYPRGAIRGTEKRREDRSRRSNPEVLEKSVTIDPQKLRAKMPAGRNKRPSPRAVGGGRSPRYAERRAQRGTVVSRAPEWGDAAAAEVLRVLREDCRSRPKIPSFKKDSKEKTERNETSQEPQISAGDFTCMIVSGQTSKVARALNKP